MRSRSFSQGSCAFRRATVLGATIATMALGALPTSAAADEAGSIAPIAGQLDSAPEFLPRPTVPEKKIMAALERPANFEFHQLPLSDALVSLRTNQGIQVQVDNKALKDAGIDLQTPVTRAVKDVSLRSALRLLLAELGMTAIIHDEVLLITTEEKASSCLVTRTYPVPDLVADDSYKELTDAIQNSIKPLSWSESGGEGALVPVKACRSIVVSQTRDVHDDVLQLLRDLREAGKLSAIAAPK